MKALAALICLLVSCCAAAQSAPFVRPDTPPTLLKSVDPHYPSEALRQNISGDVQVYFVVGTDGAVERAFVLGPGLGYDLNQSAVAAVKHYRFRPAMKDGIAVRCELQVVVSFKTWRP